MTLSQLRRAYAEHRPGTVLWSFNGAAGTGVLEHNPRPAQWPAHNSTIIFPLTLGCPISLTSEGKEWVERLIHTPDEVRTVQVPDVYVARCCGR